MPPDTGAVVMSVPFGGRVRVTTRGIQIALGLIWLLDGLFQFKSFMYTHSIVTEVFAPAAEKQWSIVGGPMHTFDAFYGHDLTLWNTLSGEIQVAIGLGLILSRKTVRPALLASFGWALVVWWFGEGFGGLTSNTLPSPLMGAPGAVILYALIGLLVWPTSRERGRSPADMGPLGDRGGLYVWSGLWALSAGLWLVNVNRASGATHEMIKGMAEASPHWLAHFQSSNREPHAGSRRRDRRGAGDRLCGGRRRCVDASALGGSGYRDRRLARLLGVRAEPRRTVLGRRRNRLQLGTAVRAARCRPLPRGSGRDRHTA